uniref:Uncharacterized protein n=1 Tax=Amphilophus citrinellus TaxID=61819 RepID=A0A3Q0SQN9_AMPCI
MSKPKPCEISCQVVQNISSVSETVSPPPVESPLTPTMRKAESPVSNTAVDPPSSFQKRASLQIEDSSVSISTQSSALTVPVAPPLPADNLTHGVNFRRHTSLANRDARTKELLSRHKSAPIPKEDANIPLVTPSLLQMVRLRSVNMTEDQVKSMSSRDGLPSRLCVKSPTSGCVSEPGATPQKSHEAYDMHKSPASTASFIFSRSTKKVVIETTSSPEVQASLKQSLAAELMQVSDQSKAAAFSFDGVKCDKVPPPVAKKPMQSSVDPSPSLPNSLAKMELNVKGNGAIGGEHISGINPSETSKYSNHDLLSLYLCLH